MLLLLFLVVEAGLRENDQVKHAELLVTVFTGLVGDVLVLIVIHETEPLLEGIEAQSTFIFGKGLRGEIVLVLVLI